MTDLGASVGQLGGSHTVKALERRAAKQSDSPAGAVAQPADSDVGGPSTDARKIEQLAQPRPGSSGKAAPLYVEQNPNPDILNPNSTPDLSQLHPNFTPDLSQLNPNFTPDLSQLNPNFIPDLSQLNPNSTPDLSQLHPNLHPGPITT